MKKVIAATGVTLTLALGTSVLPANNEAGNEAHAATQPYYNYTGYTSYDSKFLIDPDFVNALKYNNVTFNGYQFSSQKEYNSSPMKGVKVYDQTIGINQQTNKVVQISFALKQGQVSKQDVIDAYGPDYIFSGEKGSNDTGLMEYQLNGSTISIDFYKGTATSGTIVGWEMNNK